MRRKVLVWVVLVCLVLGVVPTSATQMPPPTSISVAGILDQIVDQNPPSAPSYMDIISADATQIDESHIKFEIKVNGEIPDNPGSNIGYVWGLDTDKDITTSGQVHNDIGTDFHPRVAFDNGWQGYIDNIGENTVTIINDFSISGNAVSIIVPLPKISSPESFYWLCGIAVEGGSPDRAPNSGHATFVITTTPTPTITPTPIPYPTNGPLKVKFEKTTSEILKIHIENPGPDFVYISNSTKEGDTNFKISGITWGGKLEAYVESTHPHERWTIYAKDVYKDVKLPVTLVLIVLNPPKSAIEVAAMAGPILLESATGIDPIGETLDTLIFHRARKEKVESFILFTKCFLYCKHPKTENIESKECDYFIGTIGKCSCFDVVERGVIGLSIRYNKDAYNDYKNKYDLPKKGAGYVLLPESRLVIELTYEKIREDKLGLMIKEYQALEGSGGFGTSSGLENTLLYIYQGHYKGSEHLKYGVEHGGTTFDYYSFDSISSISNQPDLTSEKPEVPTSGEKGIPGFDAVFAIVGLLVVAYLLRRRK